MKKRFLSILLSLCMVTQFVPTAALAASDDAVDNGTTTALVANETGQGSDQVAGDGDNGATGDEEETADVLANCDFSVTGDASNYTWDETTGVLTITGGAVEVSNKDADTATSQRIYIQGTAHVTLAGVNIVSSAGAPIEIRDYSDTSVTLTLEGANTLISQAENKAALHKSRDQQADSSQASTLTINGTGSLTATGGDGAAGIGGGGYHGDVHNITIDGGTINATGTGSGAGIGASKGGSTWDVVINGGNVTANGQPGIGSDAWNGVRNANIAGGMVVASSYSGSTPTGGLVSTDGGKSYTLRGDYTLSQDLTIASDGSLTVAEGAKLTVAEGATLTNEGTLVNDGAIDGSLVNDGTVYNKGTLPSGMSGTGTVYQQHVIVNGGTGTGDYNAGSTVTIAAADPEDGKMFTGWTVELGSVVLADSSQSQTTFAMPDGCVILTANYAEVMAFVTDASGNTTYYSDSNKAQEAWRSSGGTLTVCSDRFYLVGFSTPNDGVLDLNGHSITAMELTPGGTITIKNGTLMPEMGFYIQSGAQVTFEDVVIKNGERGMSGKISNYGTIISNGLALENGITIEGSGSVTGDVKTALTDSMFTLDGIPDGGYVYDGTAHVPSVKCSDDAALTENTDYTVTYSDDVTNVGTVTVTIQGIGNYAGTVTKTYEITKAAGAHTHRICGVSSCTDESHTDVVWTAWNKTDSLPSSKGSYYLTDNVTLSSASWEVSAEINLCLNGKTITGADGADVITVNEGGVLTITDCTTDGAEVGKITHNSGKTGRGVNNGGTLTLWNGSITGNTSTDADNGGGGVYNKGTFTMSGGEITNCSATSGGGVVNDRTFNMSGGSITENSATGGNSGYGGGVYNSHTFNMCGGEISSNTAYEGGGVCSDSIGTFTMSGGCISGNSTTSDGGGVYVDDSCAFNMTGGEITGCNATGSGGGVYVNGTFAMSGGKITGCSAGYGGGVCVDEDSTFKMEGDAKISNCTAAKNGGGVENSGTLTMSGGPVISGNVKGGSFDDNGNLTGGTADNVYLPDGETIAVESNKTMGPAANVGITGALNQTVVTGTTSATGFISDNTDYELVSNDENGLKLAARSVTISGVKLLNSVADEDADGADHAGEEMSGDPKSKVYDNRAVAYDAESVSVSQTITGAELVYTWQKKSGDDYADIANNEAPKAAGEYRLLVTYERGGVVFGTTEIPFTITKRHITVLNFNVGDYSSGGKYSYKTYDGTTSVKLTGFEVGNAADGEGRNLVVILSDVKFDDKNVGSNKTVTAKVALSGPSASNYTYDLVATDTAAIIPKALSITGATVTAKAYDGNTDATVTGVTFDGLQNGETLNIDTDYTVSDAKYDHADADGANKATKATFAVALKDTETAKNYKLESASGEQAASIGKATGSGTVTLDGWTYGDTANTPVVSSDTNGTEGVTYQYKVKGAADDTYAEAVPAAAGDYTVKATFPANDNYTEATATADFAIAPKELKVKDLAVAAKTYDGTTAAQLEGTPSPDGVVGADDVSLVAGTPTFSSADAGENVAVNFTDFSLSGTAKANYTLVQPSGVTGTINPAELTIIGATVEEKTYDGTTDATVTAVSFSGLVNNESLTFGTDYAVSEVAFNSANVATATMVYFSVELADTALAKNYVLVRAAGSQAAGIKKATANDRTFAANGKRGALNACEVPAGYVVNGGEVAVSVVSDTDGILDGTPAYSGGALAYTLKGAAKDGQTATVKLTVTSGNYNGYVITATLGVTEKEQVAINIADAGATYTYNGAAQAPADITVDGEKVAVADLVKTYEGVDGTSYAKSSEAPTAAGKYSVTVAVAETNLEYTGSASCTFEIGEKVLTVTATAKDKTYDGTDAATVDSISIDGNISGDKVALDQSKMAAAFDSADAGSGKTVVITGLALTDDAAGNYALPEKVTATASIAKATGSGSAALDGWTYGAVANVPVPTSDTNGTDGVTYQYKTKGAADDAYAETAPSAAGDYTVKATFPATDNYTEATATADFTISPKQLTVAATAKDKAYDGTVEAEASASLVGIVSGDDVKATVTSASFADKDAGAGKDVTVEIELTGDAAPNYTAPSTVKATASITARQLTITGADVAGKTYDGTTNATVTAVSFAGLAGGETLALGTDYAVSGAKYDGANATGEGAATKVTFSVALANTGAARNYALVSAAGEQPATIAKAAVGGYPAVETSGLRGEESTLNLSVLVVPGGEVSVSSVADADDTLDGEPTYANGNLAYTFKAAAADGQQAAVTLAVTSANYEDYTLEAILSVWPKEQVAITIADAGATYTYDGSAQAPSGISVEDDAVEAGDLVVTYAGADGTAYGPTTEAPAAAGSYVMTVAVADTDPEYYGLATCAFQIAKKELTVKDLAVADKYYDGTTAAAIAGTPELDGAVERDDISLACGLPTFSSAAVGEGVAVAFTDFSLTGADAGNYELTQPTGVTASILAYDATGAEYSATTGDWTNRDFTVTAAEGWKVSLSDAADGDWRDSLTCSDEGEGTLTFYVKNDAQGYISTAVTLGYKIDKTAPAGKIVIGKDLWTEFLETVTFGLYRKDAQTVTVTGADALSGVASVEYLVSDDDLGVDQLAGREFTTYSGAFDIEPDASLIVYVRVTDKAGNVTYLRSDGFVLDATAPVITGAENGRTYCGAVELTVADANLDTVTVNGAAVEPAAEAMALASEDADAATGVAVIVSPAEGAQTVVATDKAGNATTLALTVNDGHAWGAWVSNGDGTHTRTCRFDASHAETASCRGGKATCADRAVCDDCGGEYGEVNPSNHAALKHVAAKAATATADGNAEYWYCTACGKYFSDAAATKEIRKSDTVVPKTGDDGKKGNSSSKTDGNGKPDANKPGGQSSTDRANGSQAGASKPAAGGAKVPATGDSTAPAWPAAFLGAATIGAALLTRRKRRDD